MCKVNALTQKEKPKFVVAKFILVIKILKQLTKLLHVNLVKYAKGFPNLSNSWLNRKI